MAGVKSCSHCRRGSCHLCSGRANVLTNSPIGQSAQWTSVPCACAERRHPNRRQKRPAGAG